MPDNLADGKGQVPPASQSPDSNGQVPPVSQVSADYGDNGDGAASEPEMTPEQYRDALKRANAQAAKYRVDSKELAELRAYKEQQETAKLSDDERKDKQLADYQTKIADLERRAQEVAIRADIRLAATSLGLNEKLAYRLLDYTAIEFNEDGDPTNVAGLLAKAMADYGLPSAASSSQQQQQNQQQSASQPTPAAPAMGATNPPRGSQVAGANGTFARGEIPKLTDPRLWKR